MNEYEIIFEDESIILANKLSPMPVQREKSGDMSLQEILSAGLKEKTGQAEVYLEAVHRIDRRASGAVLFAKSQKIAAALSEALREGRIVKTYLAVVDSEPDPAEGRLEQEIAWDNKTNKARIKKAGVVEKDKLEYKNAGLSYRVRDTSERYVLLEISLETGRPHQIRAQLASIGLPVRGDLKYGARRSTKNGMIMLHAHGLEFEHPVSGEKLSFKAAPPSSDNLWKAFSEVN